MTRLRFQPRQSSRCLVSGLGLGQALGSPPGCQPAVLKVATRWQGHPGSGGLAGQSRREGILVGGGR